MQCHKLILVQYCDNTLQLVVLSEKMGDLSLTNDMSQNSGPLIICRVGGGGVQSLVCKPVLFKPCLGKW